MNLSGKNIVFVGGLGGIGYETCKNLVKKNIAYLAILDLIENPKAVKALQDAAPKTKVFYIKFDITNKVGIKKAIEEVVGKMKYIDVLINGAGLIADRNIELTMNVNVIGLIQTTMEALPYMDKTKHGRGGLIANIASVVGLEPVACFAVYTASKHAVIGFTRSLADPYYYELTGVAVTALCPGVTETNLWENDCINRDTFDYSGPLTHVIRICEKQTPAVCGEHFVRVLEANQNGSMWISDLGELRIVEPKLFWKPTVRQ